MRRRILATGVAVTALAIAALVPATAGGRTTKILEFETMAGVSRPYTGATNAIRGLAGGGLPWVIGSAKGELGTDGSLELRFSGLVFDPADAAVTDRGLGNTNPVAAMKVVVSCQTVSAGAATVANVETATFPVTTGALAAGAGSGKVEASLALPSPCIAPIVFITSPTGAWFAATGK